jgi:serine/threonine protein kinase/tetratricopeptide (TPR) repeat protein
VKAEAIDFRGTERFQVIGRIGAGGMGVVYQAHDRVRDTRVALKTLRTFTAEGILRFKNEFRALQDLQHPNLVSLGELISEGGQWFFTMELVDGVDFLSYVRPVPGFGGVVELPHVSPNAETVPPEGAGKNYEELAAPATRPDLDEPRLRGTLLQLARGLGALHGAQKVHRDVKPSNILVTTGGRVVVLDFGLATEVGGHAWSEVNVVGTADYMAPEQAASKPAGPAADWYSVGVLLYEALTGRLPFTGAPLEVLIAKQRGEPPSPRALAPSVPRDLDGLCADLLRTDPKDRPSGLEVLRRLGAAEPSTEIRLATSSHTHTAPFVGRRRELELLEDAYVVSRQGAAVTAFVQGESGVGKSALVRHFAERLRAAQPGIVILSGRCYERESVPYKALDGVVDALSRYMMRLPKAQAAQLLPLRVGLLAQVFPVLRRVEAVAEAPLRSMGPAANTPGAVDPKELRTRVFAALRELFTRLGERHPLAVIIDDLQWADADSLALLGAVLNPPDAPQLLLVATLRGAAEVATAAGSTWTTGHVRSVHVERLPPDEARELARQLMRRAGSSELSELEARGIAEEAAGHPLFIDELVRHSVVPSGESLPGAHLQLEEALYARIRRLDPPVRALLELVAVAGAPLGQESAARAVGTPRAELERHLAQLRVANLIRTTGARGADAIETYHDRVRLAVLQHLNTEATRVLHERLALALEATGLGGRADPETLATHWRGAGDKVMAAHYAAEAAAQAERALAFDRAARLYRLSLQLQPAPGASAVERSTRLGEALANIGRGGDAAIAYLSAAKQASGAASIELQRRAAEQLLVSGHIDEGLAGIRMTLQAVGLKLADTPGQAFRSLVWRRLRIRVRGIEFHEREPSQVPVEELRRIDVCWSVAIGLSLVDTIRSSDFQTRHLLLALKAGEPYRVARALAMEAAFVAASGPKSRARADELLLAADTLSKRIGHPHAIGLVAMSRGLVHFLTGEWRAALEHCTSALEIFRERCTNVNWELNTSTQFILLSLAKLGELAEMSKRMPQLRRSARERGDLYAASNLRSGVLSLYSLAADEPERAREDLIDALAKWSQQGFHLQHYWELLGKASCDLYVGDGRTGLDRITARWPVMERSMVLRVQFVWLEALDLRARASLATATRLSPGDPERERLIQTAARDAAQLRKTKTPWSPNARLLQAGVAAARGDAASALVFLDEAGSGFEATGMALHAAVVRRRQGELIGGDEGEALLRAADAWLESQRVRNPRRMTALYAPGFAD